MRRLALLLLLALTTLAGEEKQIDWIGDWEQAFKIAREQNKPVMVCINSIDSEIANKRAATGIYRDPAFVAATRQFVMVVISTLHHASEGPCPRFGRVTCAEHQACYKELRARHGEVFANKAVKYEIISPQHAWFRPDGTLLRRKEYELKQPELLARMAAVRKEMSGVSPESGGDPKPEEDGPDDDRLKPLDEKDKAELERARTPGKDKVETRRAALGNLLATEKVAALAALTEMLPSVKEEVKCDILRALGEAQQVDVLDAIYQRLEKDKSALVRSFAAVAVERIGAGESVPVLIKRARKEKDTDARRNVVRALGVCGGGIQSKEAAKALLKRVSSDKQVVVRKHAALACRSFEGEAAPLVLKKLESLALKLKDDQVRSAVIYTLAQIGNEDTTLPIFEKIKKRFEKSKDDWRLRFMRSAINVLKGQDSNWGRTLRWLFGEDRNDPARQ
ncbi:MAG: HEAT repeat domain-containing protein [Planctomycetota bacterium]